MYFMKMAQQGDSTPKVKDDSLAFVSIRSTDIPILHTHSRIEKLTYHWHEISKGQFLYDLYMQKIKELECEKDPNNICELIAICESLFVNSLTLYLKAFHDQKGLKLDISNVTNDRDLFEQYFKIKAIRDDDFVHWKGSHSNAALKFQMDKDKKKFTGQINILAKSNFGDGNPIRMRRLFGITLDHIEYRRQKSFSDLAARLHIEKAYSKTDFIDDDGNVVIDGLSWFIGQSIASQIPEILPKKYKPRISFGTKI